MTTTRFDYARLAPDAFRAMLALETAVKSSGIEPSLYELVKLRASQMNGCAYCIDMHTLDARAAGETEQRLYLLDAWRETPFYTERERAALAWTEALTFIAKGHAADDVYEQVRGHFSEPEIAALTFAVTVINAWNRLAISSRTEPGHYKPRVVTSSHGDATRSSQPVASTPA